MTTTDRADMAAAALRVAVVGHVEWIEFATVDHVPAPGEIVHAWQTWQESGGGGAVAAVQLAKLAGSCTFYTAFGDDELGHRAKSELQALGVRVEATFRAEPQRRGFTYIDASGERTITVIGERMGPHGVDPLPWEELSVTDAVYFTAGDGAALEAARTAKVLVATSRALPQLGGARVPLDALVGSGRDGGERYALGDLDPEPALVVATDRAEGGTYRMADGRSGSYGAAPLAHPLVDSYGCGDSFAAGLTYALGAGRELDDALALAARCGTACLAGRGPYRGQLADPTR